MTSALISLLETTHDALLSGDLAALSRLAGEVDAQASRLPPLTATEARHLRQLAERNARLLRAAGAGVRAARQRLDQIAQGPRLSTYDSHGRKALIADSPAAALRRV